jgi:hypothetical protein
LALRKVLTLVDEKEGLAFRFLAENGLNLRAILVRERLYLSLDDPDFFFDWEFEALSAKNIPSTEASLIAGFFWK